MTGVPPTRVVVNLEHEFDLRGRTEKRCDRFFFLFILLEIVSLQPRLNSKVGKPLNQM